MERKRVLFDILAKIATRIMRIMKAEICSIWLKDEEGNLRPQVSHGINPEFANLLFSKKGLNALGPISNGGTPFQLYEMSKFCSNRFKKYIEREKLKSLLACPIFIKGRKIGMIAICTKNKHHTFTQNEKLLFFAMTKEIAFVIRKKELANRVRKDYLNTMKTIADILEANDRYTYGHSNKVTKYAINICKGLKLSTKKLKLVEDAALLHDIGKIGINRKILNKKGRLTISEWEEVKKHPSIGAEIVEQTGILNDLVPIIRHHHERFDGGGYPDPGFRNGKIPMEARIIAIADAYDAMTSERPYRDRPLTQKMALSEIEKNAGKQFDPELAKLFISQIAKEAKIKDRIPLQLTR